MSHFVSSRTPCEHGSQQSLIHIRQAGLRWTLRVVRSAAPPDTFWPFVQAVSRAVMPSNLRTSGWHIKTHVSCSPNLWIISAWDFLSPLWLFWMPLISFFTLDFFRAVCGVSPQKASLKIPLESLITKMLMNKIIDCFKCVFDFCKQVHKNKSCDVNLPVSSSWHHSSSLCLMRSGFSSYIYVVRRARMFFIVS